MHRTSVSGHQLPTPHAVHRLGALMALALTPLAAYGLGRLAWDQAQAVFATAQPISGAGLSTLSLGQALSPVAATVGALVAAHLAWTTLVLVATPRHSRLRAAVAAVTPAAWRRVVTLATTGTLSLGLALPATAITDTTTLDNTDAGWVTTPAAATVEVESRPPEPTTEATVAVTEVTSASNLSSETTGSAGAQADAQIVVSPGDTLWDITATQLDIPLDEHARIASAWPALYDENRDTIGEDPGLIVPGQNLTAPAGWAS